MGNNSIRGQVTSFCREKGICPVCISRMAREGYRHCIACYARKRVHKRRENERKRL